MRLIASFLLKLAAKYSLYRVMKSDKEIKLGCDCFFLDSWNLDTNGSASLFLISQAVILPIQPSLS